MPARPADSPADRPLTGSDRTFPPNSGTAAGWVGLGVAAFLVVGVFRESSLHAGIRVLCGALLFAVLTFAFMLRPRVRTRGGDLVLVNPFVDIVVPVSAMTALEVRSATYVFVGRKRYVGVAIGRSRRAMVPPRGASGGVPGFGGLGGRRVERHTPGGTQAKSRDSIPDLLEEWARSEIAMARSAGGEAGVVRREPVWWLIGLAVAAGIALVVSLVV